MIRNSTARHAMTTSHASIGTAGVASTTVRPMLARPRRRPGVHVVVSKPAMRGFGSATPACARPSRPSACPSLFPQVSHRVSSKSSAILTHPQTQVQVRVFPSTQGPSSPFSTFSAQKKKHGGKGTEAAAAPAVEGEVIYRKEGSKIVPIVSPADEVEAPISGLFTQFEDVARPSASAPEVKPPKTATSGDDVDLSSLTLKDVLPPDEFIGQLIKQKEYKVTVDQIKDLVQTILDVLPLKQDDARRVQAEKKFWNACRKQGVSVYELASWALKYTRDGAPLSFTLLKLAVDNGDVYSRYSYGVMLYRGAKGVPANPTKGRAIIESLAKPSVKSRISGLPMAMSTLASIYAREDKNYDAARDMYLAAANAGVVEARVSLGRMYLSGELPQDTPMARKCFELAIKTDDNAEAHFLLGALEMNEDKPNFKSAFQHYQKAASKGLAEAQYNVGQSYFKGIGVPKNDALAVEYWKMSGQQGFGLAQLSLGAYYFQDETPQEHKNEEGPMTKANVVQHEWDPSKKDLMQAQKWFTLASRRPGQLGLEGKRLKAQVDTAIKKGGGGSRDGRACVIM